MIRAVQRLRSAPESAGHPSSAVWTLAIAAIFFFLSNPLTMVPFFGDSLHRAILVAAGASVLTLPWLRLPVIPWPVLPVVALMYASLAWTITWDVTWGVSLVYVKIALIAVACASCANIRTIASGITLGGVVVVIASIYAYVEKLPFADVPLLTDGYLAGAGGNRNILSYTLVIAWAFALAAVPRQMWSRLLWAGAVAVIAVGLFLSQSGTGFVAAGLLVAIAGVLSLGRLVPIRLVRRVRLLAVGAGVLVLGLGFLGLPLLGAMLGRDVTTLSGRTDLWASIWRACVGQRALGQGWGTTWPHAWVQAPPNPRFDAISTEVGAVYSHGHNSLIDVLPDLGVLGMAAFALLHLYLLFAALRHWRAGHADPRGGMVVVRVAVLALVALVLFGITEPMATIPLGWFVLVLLACATRRPSPEAGDAAVRSEADSARGPDRADRQHSEVPGHTP